MRVAAVGPDPGRRERSSHSCGDYRSFADDVGLLPRNGAAPRPRCPHPVVAEPHRY